MVQKEPGRRGRPRAYDPDAALARAMDAFWGAGFAATSLDELSAVTGMNRPSLYAAFGDKHALYMKALERYRADARAALAEALAPSQPLAEGLAAVYRSALALYLSEDEGGRGCFVIGTAATEAVRDPDARAALAGIIAEIDEAFAARIALARAEHEIDLAADPMALAKLASAVLHSLAIRARAGAGRAELEALAEAGIALICAGAER